MLVEVSNKFGITEVSLPLEGIQDILNRKIKIAKSKSGLVITGHDTVYDKMNTFYLYALNQQQNEMGICRKEEYIGSLVLYNDKNVEEMAYFYLKEKDEQ